MEWCVCIEKETSELFVMERIERETMLSVLIDLKQPIPSYVISVKDSKEAAENYVEKIKAMNDLINKTFEK